MTVFDRVPAELGCARRIAARLAVIGITVCVGGCAPRQSPGLATSASHTELEPERLCVGHQIALLGQLQSQLVERGDVGDELPPMSEIVLLDTALGAGRSHSVPAELIAILQAEIVRARTSEPIYNEVHFGWGFFFGLVGLSPEHTFEILRGWEEFEHTSTIGKTFGLEMEEGVFGYLWDLERGMQGYAEGVAYLRGEGRSLSDANPHDRRGGYLE